MHQPEALNEANNEASTIRERILNKCIEWLLPEINRPPSQAVTGIGELASSVVAETSGKSMLVEVNPPKMETDLGPIYIKHHGDAPSSIEGQGRLASCRSLQENF